MNAPESESPPPASTRTTACCIAGAGPGGAVLALLLARRGVEVTLLEQHADFDRDFRGDTLHPGVLEVLDQLGLAERLLELPHTKMRQLSFHTRHGSVLAADLSRLKTKFPYVLLLPQARFLEFITNEASRYPSFHLEMSAAAHRLLTEQQRTVGVVYRDGAQTPHEVRAALTVASDGRFSRLRQLAGLTPRRASPPIDVLWFRLPRFPEQPGGGFLAPGQYMILLDRGEQWQAGYVFPKGGYQELRTAGLDALKKSIAELAPPLAKSLAALHDWQDLKLLSIEASRLDKWHAPGLLFIGDAAHVMSPVGGVGINCAIADAVEAANVLATPLLSGTLTDRHLAAVQRRREFPTRVAQRLQAFDLEYLVGRALQATGDYRLPWWLRFVSATPLLRDVPARLFAFGWRRVRVEDL